MTTLIVNSNRLDLIDDYHAQNKSIIIDSEKHELLFNDGTGTYSTKEQSAEDARVGDLADLTTTEKSTVVGAINEVNSGVSNNAGSISSLGETVSSLEEDVSGLRDDVSSLDTRVTALEQAPAILPSYSYAGTLAGLAATDWETDASAPVAAYGYKATLNTVHSVADTTAYNEAGNVYFSPADAVSGKLAPYAELTKVNYSPVTVVGNPTIDSNSVMTTPDASNYVRSTGLIDLSQASTWEITIPCEGEINGSYDHNGSVLAALVSADRSTNLVEIVAGSTTAPEGPYMASLVAKFYNQDGSSIGTAGIWWYDDYRDFFRSGNKGWIKIGYDGTNYYGKRSTDGVNYTTRQTFASATKLAAGYLSIGSSYKTGNSAYWGSGYGGSYGQFKIYLGEASVVADDSTAWEYTSETEQRYAFNIWASEAIATGSIDYSISLLPKGAN